MNKIINDELIKLMGGAGASAGASNYTLAGATVTPDESSIEMEPWRDSEPCEDDVD